MSARDIQTSRHRDSLRYLEQVVWVVGCLNANQAIIVRSVIGALPVTKVRVEIVDIAAAAGVLAQVGMEIADPGDVARLVRLFRPAGQELGAEQGIAVHEGGL